MATQHIRCRGTYWGQGFFGLMFGSEPIRTAPIDVGLDDSDIQRRESAAEEIMALVHRVQIAPVRIGSIFEVVDVTPYIDFSECPEGDGKEHSHS